MRFGKNGSRIQATRVSQMRLYSTIVKLIDAWVRGLWLQNVLVLQITWRAQSTSKRSITGGNVQTCSKMSRTFLYLDADCGTLIPTGGLRKRASYRYFRRHNAPLLPIKSTADQSPCWTTPGWRTPSGGVSTSLS